MEKAKRKSQPGRGFNFQYKRYFEFVSDLPLEECVVRLSDDTERDLDNLVRIHQRMIKLTVETLKPGEQAQLFLQAFTPNRSRCFVESTVSIQRLGDNRTLISGEAGLNRAIARWLILFMVFVLVAAIYLLVLCAPACGFPIFGFAAVLRDALDIRNGMVEFVTTTLKTEKPKHDIAEPAAGIL
jgi:hypothetical protein